MPTSPNINNIVWDSKPSIDNIEWDSAPVKSPGVISKVAGKGKEFLAETLGTLESAASTISGLPAFAADIAAFGTGTAAAIAKKQVTAKSTFPDTTFDFDALAGFTWLPDSDKVTMGEISREIRKHRETASKLFHYTPQTKSGKRRQGFVNKATDFLIGTPARIAGEEIGEAVRRQEEFSSLIPDPVEAASAVFGKENVAKAMDAVTKFGLELRAFEGVIGLAKLSIPVKEKLKTGEKLTAKEARDFEEFLKESEVFTRARLLKNPDILDALRGKEGAHPDAVAFIQSLTTKERKQLSKDLLKKEREAVPEDRPLTVEETVERAGGKLPQLATELGVEKALAVPDTSKIQWDAVVDTAAGAVLRDKVAPLTKPEVLPAGKEALALPETTEVRSQGAIPVGSPIKPDVSLVTPLPKDVQGNRIKPRDGVFGELTETVSEDLAPTSYYNISHAALNEKVDAGDVQGVADSLGLTVDSPEKRGDFISFRDSELNTSFMVIDLNKTLDKYKANLTNLVESKQATLVQVKGAKAKLKELDRFETVDTIEDTADIDVAISKTEAQIKAGILPAVPKKDRFAKLEARAKAKAARKAPIKKAPEDAVFPEMFKEAPVEPRKITTGTNLKPRIIEKGLSTVQVEGKKYFLFKEGTTWSARAVPEAGKGIQTTETIVSGGKNQKTAIDFLLEKIKEAKEFTKRTLGNEGGFINFFGVKDPKKSVAKKTKHPTTRENLYEMDQIDKDFKWPKWAEFWDPLVTLPDSNKFKIMRLRASGEIDKATRTINHLRTNLDKYDMQTREAIFDFERGKLDIKDLNKEAQKDALAIQRLSRFIGRKTVDLGLISSEVYEANKNKYIPYMYVRNIVGDGKIVTDRSGTVNIGYTIAKNPNLTDKERVALGWIKDASVVVPVGYGKILLDIPVVNRYNQIAANPKWVWQDTMVDIPGVGKMSIDRLTQEVEKVTLQVNAQPTPEAMDRLQKLEAALKTASDKSNLAPEKFIKMPLSKKYGDLSGAFVLRPIYDDIIPLSNFDPTVDAGKKLMRQAEGRSVAVFKMFNVALNPPTAIRNTVSNFFQNYLRGTPFHRLLPDTILGIKSLLAKDKDFNNHRINGGFSTNMSETELKEILDTFVGADPNRLDSVLLALQDVAKYYGKIDDIAKHTIYTQMIRDGHSIPEAILEAQFWGMDYSLVPRSIKHARRHGAPFITYTYHATRLLKESLLRNPLKLLFAVSALGHVIPEISRMWLGMTEEEFQQARRDLPEAMRKNGTNLLLPWRDDEGRLKWVNVAGYLPWTNTVSILKDLVPFDLAELRRDSGISNPMFSIFGSATLAVADPNHIPHDPFSGIPIYSSLDAPHVKLAKYMEFVYNIFAPSSATRWGAGGRTIDAMRGTQDKYGRGVSAGEAVGRWFGANTFTQDIRQTDAEKTFKINLEKKAFRADIKKLALKEENLLRRGLSRSEKSAIKAKIRKKEDALIKRFENKVDRIAEGKN